MVNFDLIKKLIQIVKDENISGLVIEEGGTKYAVSANTSYPIPVAVSSPPAATAKKEEPKNEDDGLLAITSPMVGTFYKSPSPDSPPFVNVGDQVAPGKVVCIVEAMKLFNEIESEISGKIVKLLVENGKPVEYGQKLMLVKKD